MKKQVIDCSLPPDHPDHIKIVDVTPEEEAALLQGSVQDKAGDK